MRIRQATKRELKNMQEKSRMADELSKGIVDAGKRRVVQIRKPLNKQTADTKPKD